MRRGACNRLWIGSDWTSAWFAAQAMLAMDDTGALLRFVQRPNRVSLREGEAALKAAGRYSELVALYQERGQYSAALDLLRTLSLVCHWSYRSLQPHTGLTCQRMCSTEMQLCIPAFMLSCVKLCPRCLKGLGSHS